jgi:microcystin degradation protein MlrC
MRIAIAGFQHETNTFAPALAGFADFEKADAWPGLTRGRAVVEDLAGMNLPVTGFVEAALARGCDLVPILWCSAEPSSYVTEEAFERIAAMICDGLAAAGPLDAVYLDLHGAMVAEHHEDGEGELLRRLRGVVGHDLPVAVSLDLHANVTAAMTELATAMTVFRTYPHLDMAETGARAFALLEAVMAGSVTAKAFRKLPYLVPLSAQYTGAEPGASLYGRLPGLAKEGVVSIDFAFGFPPADIADCGPAIVAYGNDKGAVEAAAEVLREAVLDAEDRFENALLAPAEAVRLAKAEPSAKPVVLADVQDNPGAGGSSDTVGVLEALLEGGAEGAVLALLHDPEVAARAHAAGPGAAFRAALGGKSGQAGQAPLEAELAVEALGDGRFLCTGEMYRGCETELGPMALLKVLHEGADVRIVVGSERFQCLDQAVFRHLGVEPAEQRILVVKSTVHFRADFEPIASKVLLVEAPGAHPCRLEGLAYRRLRPGVRLGPGGPAFDPHSGDASP